MPHNKNCTCEKCRNKSKYGEDTLAIEKLIDDEIEAVRGYEEAIIFFDCNNELVEKLTEIKDDELEHIRELKKMSSKIGDETNATN